MQAFGIDPEKPNPAVGLGAHRGKLQSKFWFPTSAVSRMSSVIDVLVKDGQQIDKETPLITHRDRKGGDGRAGSGGRAHRRRSSSNRATRFPKGR